MFTKEELNTIGIIVSAAQIAGKDARLIVALLDKITALWAQADAPLAPPEAE